MVLLKTGESIYIIYFNLGKSIPIIAAFLDLAKAFDTVNHKILLEKLDRYGIRGNALKLLTSYLSDRLPKVKINEYISPYKLQLVFRKEIS